MKGQVEELKNRVFAKKDAKGSILTAIMDFMRQFSSLGEIIGRSFEVRDSEGKLVYTIRQKPMKMGQFNTLMKEYGILKKLDHEREQAMFGGKKGRSRRR